MKFHIHLAGFDPFRGSEKLCVICRTCVRQQLFDPVGVAGVDLRAEEARQGFNSLAGQALTGSQGSNPQSRRD
ncbi:MAG: hypothetical protein R3301_05730 [Saprospiraceae bacterium]|nr:hypothetical protein [Saprospiraceae bacterium]